MNINRRTGWGIAALVAVMLALFFMNVGPEPRKHAAKPPPAAGADVLTSVVAPAAPPSAPVPQPPSVNGVPERPAGTARTELPKLGTNASSRVWVRGTFGPGDDQFGKVKTEGEQFPPQGFVATADGRLMVLDTGKQRLIRYSADGKLEASIPLPADSLVIPADVAITADGTIAIIDHPGMNTSGTLLLDASGKKKGEMPQLADTLNGLYAAGNDLYVDTDGLSSVKLGNAQGIPDDESPGVQQHDDGRIPGRVAPDGKTGLRFFIDDKEHGEFSVVALRGDPPEEVFTRFFQLPNLAGIPYLQADAAGRIYMVVNYRASLALVCLDGKTGDPVGMVGLPMVGGGGTQLRLFNVAPQGGLIQAVAREDEMSFEVYNCHP